MEIHKIVETILGKINDKTRLVAFGESHEDPFVIRGCLKRCLVPFREAGFTHLALEYSPENAERFYSFLKEGKSFDAIAELSEWGWYEETWKDVISTACGLGFGFLLIDNHKLETDKERDEFMGNELIANLNNGTKIIALLGLVHTNKIVMKEVKTKTDYFSASARAAEVVGTDQVTTIASSDPSGKKFVWPSLKDGLPCIVDPSNLKEYIENEQNSVKKEYLEEEYAQTPVRISSNKPPGLIYKAGTKDWDYIVYHKQGTSIQEIQKLVLVEFVQSLDHLESWEGFCGRIQQLAEKSVRSKEYIKEIANKITQISPYRQKALLHLLRLDKSARGS